MGLIGLDVPVIILIVTVWQTDWVTDNVGTRDATHLKTPLKVDTSGAAHTNRSDQLQYHSPYKLRITAGSGQQNDIMVKSGSGGNCNPQYAINRGNTPVWPIFDTLSKPIFFVIPVLFNHPYVGKNPLKGPIFKTHPHPSAINLHSPKYLL